MAVFGAERSPRRERGRLPSPRSRPWRGGLSPWALSTASAGGVEASGWPLSSKRGSWRGRSGRSPRAFRLVRPSGRSPLRASDLSVRSGRPSPRSARSPRRPPRRPSCEPLPDERLSLRSPGLGVPRAASAAGAAGAVSPPNNPLSQPKKPFSAGADAGAVGRVAAWRASGARAGRASAAGAGMSGNTPLMTGDWRLVGSCERRVTAVGSSMSSAIL